MTETRSVCVRACSYIGTCPPERSQQINLNCTFNDRGGGLEILLWETCIHRVSPFLNTLSTRTHSTSLCCDHTCTFSRFAENSLRKLFASASFSCTFPKWRKQHDHAVINRRLGVTRVIIFILLLLLLKCEGLTQPGIKIA